MITIVIIDSNDEERNRVRSFLSSQKDLKVVGTGKDGYDALKKVETFKPDIIIIELDLRYLEGADFYSLIKVSSPHIKIIVYTSHADEKHILWAISNDAMGYFLKDIDFHCLPKYIPEIYAGEHLFNPKIVAKVIRMLSELLWPGSVGKWRKPHIEKERFLLIRNMSRTELHVMAMLAAGRTNKEIAAQLRLNTGTIRNSISSTLQKTGLRDRTQIALYAMKLGLVRMDFPCIQGN